MSLCLCVLNKNNDRRINYTADFVLVHGDTEEQRKNFSIMRNKRQKNSVSPCLCVLNKYPPQGFVQEGDFVIVTVKVRVNVNVEITDADRGAGR